MTVAESPINAELVQDRSLRGMAIANAGAWLALAVGGLVLGFAFGAIVFRTNYCAMGSLSDIVNFGDWRRFRAWIFTAVRSRHRFDTAGSPAIPNCAQRPATTLNSRELS